MRFKDTKQYAAHRKWVKAHPEHAKRLSRETYHRAHPNAKTIAQVIADKEAKALRTEKACKRCGVVKPMGCFTPQKRTADGRQYQCKECIAITARARYQRNPELACQPVKNWQKKNPEKLLHGNHVRRARNKQVPGSHTISEWKTVCAKFRNRCVRCGATGKLTRDHIIPVTNQHCSNDISNIQPLCFSCNSSKGNRHSADYRKSPFINQGQIPLFT